MPWGFLPDRRERQWRQVERTCHLYQLCKELGATGGQSCSMSAAKGQAFVPIPSLRGSPDVTSLGRPRHDSADASKGWPPQRPGC